MKVVETGSFPLFSARCHRHRRSLASNASAFGLPPCLPGDRQARMRVLLSASLALCLLVGCGSDSSSSGGGDGGVPSAQAGAQVRFRYKADWKDHLGACATISNYRIKFGATPTPITVPIDVTADSLGQYVALEGRTYKDSDVLHAFSCNTSTKEEYGRFGADLSLAPSKRYTVTLGGTAATVAEDP
jgi:hypothetical protein